jgi:hypothetical protein
MSGCTQGFEKAVWSLNNANILFFLLSKQSKYNTMDASLATSCTNQAPSHTTVKAKKVRVEDTGRRNATRLRGCVAAISTPRAAPPHLAGAPAISPRNDSILFVFFRTANRSMGEFHSVIIVCVLKQSSSDNVGLLRAIGGE